MVIGTIAEGEIVSRRYNAYATPGVHDQKILVTRHDDRGIRGDGKFQIFVVLGITTVADLVLWGEPDID